MMTLSDFEKYLSANMPLPEPAQRHLNGEKQQLLNWAASLPTQAEGEQVKQLEKVLTELSGVDIDDELRLSLMSIVSSAMVRSIATLRKHYIYTVGTLSAEQLNIMQQVKSLYYLTLLAYNGVICRARAGLAAQQQQDLSISSSWQRFLMPKREMPITLAVAIYQSLAIYQKLAYEKALHYQKPPTYMWSALNQLYYLACVQHLTDTDLSKQLITRQAASIHELYCQICLHSLLNVLAMCRSSMLLIQRLLPTWASYINATLEPQTQTRLFVDLKSAAAPEYLTVMTDINPYEERHDCLFIELEPLVSYLRERQNILLASAIEMTEYRLITKVLLAIDYRYSTRQAALPSKYGRKQPATIITNFNDIHYHAAGRRSLMSIMGTQDLPIEYLPHAASLSVTESQESVVPVQLQRYTDKMAHFEMAHLAAPPRLTLMSLFLLNNNKVVDKSTDTDDIESWSLGMVRWLTLDEKSVAVEGQILAYQPLACALRLNNRDHRSQRFIPALLLAGEPALDSVGSLLVPSHHFKPDDKVIIRLNEQQSALRLQRCLLTTKAFMQYEVTRLAVSL